MTTIESQSGKTVEVTSGTEDDTANVNNAFMQCEDGDTVLLKPLIFNIGLCEWTGSIFVLTDKTDEITLKDYINGFEISAINPGECVVIEEKWEPPAPGTSSFRRMCEGFRIYLEAADSNLWMDFIHYNWRDYKHYTNGARRMRKRFVLDTFEDYVEKKLVEVSS